MEKEYNYKELVDYLNADEPCWIKKFEGAFGNSVAYSFVFNYDKQIKINVDENNANMFVDKQLLYYKTIKDVASLKDALKEALVLRREACFREIKRLNNRVDKYTNLIHTL